MEREQYVVVYERAGSRSLATVVEARNAREAVEIALEGPMYETDDGRYLCRVAPLVEMAAFEAHRATTVTIGVDVAKPEATVVSSRSTMTIRDAI